MPERFTPPEARDQREQLAISLVFKNGPQFADQFIQEI